jgi:Fe-S cluster assembly protein SufD
VTAFDRRAIDLISQHQPPWRVEQMADALAGFEAQELPSGAEEEWRYVNLGVDLDRMSPATEAGEALADDDFVRLARQGDLAASVTIVDGSVREAQSSGPVTVQRLSQLDELRPAAPVDRDKLAAAHLAFARDGIRVEVGRRQVLEAPILIDVQSTQPGVMSFPHVELAVGAEADAGFLVIHRSPDGVEMVSVPGLTLEADDGGRIRFQAVQDWGDATVGVVHQRVRLGRDATGWIGEAGLGGRVGRLDLHAELEGAGSSTQIVGLYFGEGDQTLDYRMLIDHIGRSTSSDVFLKGAVEDSAQSIFTGLLRIEKDALRSSAFETNRNLVLSENAKAHSVPNLEILCNDVVCGHGSSVGPLEEEYLYYLESRGISRDKAERMLIRGFFTEVIDRLPVDVVARPIQDAVFQRFVQAQEGGRLS